MTQVRDRRHERRPVATTGWIRAWVAASALVLAWSASADEGWKTKAADRGNRFEGLIAEESANPQWELLSFTARRDAFAPASRMRVAFYLPPDAANEASSSFVVARELADARHYRMESKAAAWTAGAWNSFGPWTTDAVIDKYPDLRDNLGVAVFTERGLAATTRVVPVVVQRGDEVVDETVARYELVMRSSRTARKVHCQLDRVATGASAAPVTSADMPGAFVRGEPIVIALDAPREDGRYRITACATPAIPLPEYLPGTNSICPDGDLERSYLFYHRGRVQLPRGER